jgi:hypothetical protein
MNYFEYIASFLYFRSLVRQPFYIEDTSFVMNDEYTGELTEEMLEAIKDPFIDTIRFGNKFNRPVRNIPLNITTIYFGIYYNQEIKKIWITPFLNLSEKPYQIYFSHKFNSNISNIDSFINKIVFSDKFNQPIKDFPFSIKHLEFGEGFNQNLYGLKYNDVLGYLRVGRDFNQPLDNLNENLTKLIIESDKFNFPLTNLPRYLKKLVLGTGFNQILFNLPRTIETIEILNPDYNMIIYEILPPKLKSIVISQYYPYLSQLIQEYGNVEIIFL